MPSSPGRSELDIWWHIGRATVGNLVRINLRIRAYGTAHLPLTQPALLAANHLSFLDPIVIGLVVSDRGRPVHFLAASEFYEQPVLGWAMRKIGQIPVKRGTADRAALQELGAMVRRGSLAAIFPEGRRTDPDERLRGNKGVARIALAADEPVIPVGLWGTHHKWPRRGGPKLFPLRPRVAVCFGPAIPPDGDLASRADVRALTDRVMDEVSTLTIEARKRAEG
jgi:1-acyl-sn-glycerol-3-phosphate acyltransferase